MPPPRRNLPVNVGMPCSSTLASLSVIDSKLCQRLLKAEEKCRSLDGSRRLA